MVTWRQEGRRSKEQAAIAGMAFKRQTARVRDGIEHLVAAPFSLRAGGVGVAHADVRQATAHDGGRRAMTRGSRTQPEG